MVTNEANLEPHLPGGSPYLGMLPGAGVPPSLPLGPGCPGIEELLVQSYQ